MTQQSQINAIVTPSSAHSPAGCSSKQVPRPHEGFNEPAFLTTISARRNEVLPAFGGLDRTSCAVRQRVSLADLLSALQLARPVGQLASCTSPADKQPTLLLTFLSLNTLTGAPSLVSVVTDGELDCGPRCWRELGRQWKAWASLTTSLPGKSGS